MPLRVATMTSRSLSIPSTLVRNFGSCVLLVIGYRPLATIPRAGWSSRQQASVFVKLV